MEDGFGSSFRHEGEIRAASIFLPLLLSGVLTKNPIEEVKLPKLGKETFRNTFLINLDPVNLAIGKASFELMAVTEHDCFGVPRH